MKKGIICALAMIVILCMAPVISKAEPEVGMKSGSFYIENNDTLKTCTIVGFVPNGEKTLQIPATLSGYKVTKIGSGAFISATDLTAIVLGGDFEFEWSAEAPIFSSPANLTFYGVSATKALAYAGKVGSKYVELKTGVISSLKKNVNLTSVAISFPLQSPAVQYEIYRKLGKGAYSLVKSIKTNQYQDGSLAAGKTYFYKVVPVYQTVSGDLIRGSLFQEKQVSLVPATVSKFRAKVHRGYIQLRWSRNKNVSGYQLSRKVHVNIKGFHSSFYHLKTFKGYKHNSVKNTHLVRKMKYSYRIRAFKLVKGKRIYSDWKVINKKRAR